MRHLQWPELADAARERNKDPEIHNSEAECLYKLLAVYELSPNSRNA